MRSAPAVDFPVGGAATLRNVHRVLVGVILLLLAAWTLQTHPPAALACAAWALGLTIIVGAWRLAGDEFLGQLSWTGRLWWLHPAPQHARHDPRVPVRQGAGHALRQHGRQDGPQHGRQDGRHDGRQGRQKVAVPPASAPTRVDVVWDGQHWMLLHLRPSGQPAQWACVARSADAPRWPALRRALMRDGVARVEGRLRGAHA